LISQETLFLVQNTPKPVFRPASAWTRWGSLQCSPSHPSWIWGRRGETEKGGRGREKGGEGKGRGKGGKKKKKGGEGKSEREEREGKEEKYFGPPSSEKLAPPLRPGFELGATARKKV